MESERIIHALWTAREFTHALLLNPLFKEYKRITHAM